MFRKPQILIPYLLLVAALAGVALWWQGRQGLNMGGEVPVLGKVVSDGAVAVGGPFTLTGTDGKRVSDQDFQRPGRHLRNSALPMRSKLLTRSPTVLCSSRSRAGVDPVDASLVEPSA